MKHHSHPVRNLPQPHHTVTHRLPIHLPAAHANVVSVVAAWREDDAGGDGDPLAQGRFVQLHGVDVFGEFDPQHEAALRLGDARAFGEVFKDEAAQLFAALCIGARGGAVSGDSIPINPVTRASAT